ncbi:SDR family NAD(P)-dependent oxidoreductase [Rhodococcus hoagii]|nr:SDR family NAD(P)-dependent oxidoreductase [Prescottella equi]
MAPSLTGRTALVTGSSRGIGRAVAQRLAAEGATVVVTARSRGVSESVRAGRKAAVAGSLDETVSLIEEAGGRAVAIPADLEDAQARDQLVDKVVDSVGSIDILVNNRDSPTTRWSRRWKTATFDRTVDHYLRVPFALSRAAIPHMRKQGGGLDRQHRIRDRLALSARSGSTTKISGDVIYGSMKRLSTASPRGSQPRSSTPASRSTRWARPRRS